MFRSFAGGWGTDVLNAISREAIRRNVARVDWIVSTNVAVAPHLVDELATIGIRARYVPSVIDVDSSSIVMADWADASKPVLVYLPSQRKEFFGARTIESVIAGNPDLHFIVVADETHSLAAYANVESLGWVWDMRQLYLRAGCILRITTHDGLPRMLIASLLHGLYAIYSWPLQGCWRARTVEEIDGRLAQYRMATRPNIEGRMAIQALLNGKPELQMADAITGSSVPARLRLRGMSLAMHTGIFAGRLA